MMSAIRGWLEGLGLGRHADTFEREDIDLGALRRLSDDDLKELGLTMGPRRKVLAAIAELAPAVEPKAPTVPREAERRQLTVMFCDLVGSTALSAKLDPEDLRALMQAYQQAAGSVIERYEGHVAQYLGDGLLTYFGWPQAHEDDAERAIRAGLEIVAAVKAVEAPSPLQIRIGIATGAVVVGETGEGDASVPKLAVGETPNLAARLQGLAGADQIVIAPATRRLIGNAFTLDDLGTHALKGIVESVEAWRVTGLGTAEGRFEATRGSHLTPFVGREAEVMLLMEKWEQAKDGEGQVVLVCGEPGIGKSRVTQVLRERVSEEPHTRLRYQCSPYHTNSAFHPVIEQLERAAGFERDDDVEAKLAKLEGLVGTEGNVPALFGSMLSLDGGDRYPALNMSPQKQKEETLQAIADQASELSEQQPVLMIFEDAHWIDPTSQEMLDLMVPQIAGQRVLLVATYRPEYEPPWPQGLGHLTTVNLNRLGRKQAAAMVARVTDGKSLPNEVLEQIVAKTDGVPLFVEELTKTVIESGIVREAGDRYELTGPLTDLAIPSTIQDSLMARLDRLAPVKEVAQLGACIGREFGYELVAALCAMDEKTLTESLQQLELGELIFRNGTPPNATYTFKHALVQEAAYESLLRSKRERTHYDIARALQDRFGEAVESNPELLAHHFSAAGRKTEAVDFWTRAGKRAIRNSANREAISFLTEALDLLTSSDDIADQLRKELDLRISLGAPLQALEGYGSPNVERTYRKAHDLCERVGQTPDLGRALRGLYVFSLMRGELARAHDYGARLQALSDTIDDDSLRLEASFAFGQTLLFHAADLEGAIKHLENGIHLYDVSRHGAHAFLYGQDPGVYCTILAGWAYWLLGYPDTALACCEAGIAIAREIRHPLSEAAARMFAATIHHFRREPDAANELAGVVAKLSDEHDLPFFGAWAQIIGSWGRYVATGAPDGVVALEAGIKGFRATAGDLLIPYFLTLLAQMRADAGDFSGADKSLTQARLLAAKNEEHWSDALLIWTEATILALRGKAERAEVAFLKAIETAEQQGAKSPQLRAVTGLTRLLIAQGRKAEARDRLRPIFDWFTEARDGADVKEAGEVLRTLQ